MSEPARRYEVVLAGAARDQLRRIRKRHGTPAAGQLLALIKELSDDPESKTEPLCGLLKGFRSLHSGRFRVVVRVARQVVRVYVVAIGWHESGHRADVYKLLEEAVKRGRIRPEDFE